MWLIDAKPASFLSDTTAGIRWNRETLFKELGNMLRWSFLKIINILIAHFES